MFPRSLLTLLILFGQAQIGGCADGGADAGIEVRDAVIREAVPGRTNTVAYFSITNRGTVPVQLLGAHSDYVERLELHTHVRNGDMIGMRRVDAVDLAPQQAVVFASGGHHLMVFGAKGLPSPVPVTLEFSDGSTQVVEFRRVGLDGLEHVSEDVLKDVLKDAF
ncbi:MAG: copper chaperone PCu(A)C [Gammaproteobacteria bacterium]|nr:copper chaperone PCu(A)C [Gammaproteobacteria bacterium]